MRINRLTFILTAIFLLAGYSVAAEDNGAEKSSRVLIKFRQGRNEKALSDIRAQGNKGPRKTRQVGRQGWWLMQFDQTEDFRKIAHIYRRHPDVLMIEPDYKVHALEHPESSTIFPNDPRFDDLWALDNTGQTFGTADADIDAVEAWSLGTSSTILVAVIDTGIDTTHPDLAANIWVNTAEIANNGIDDDHNGFVDDRSGWDFAYNDNDPYDGEGHGTHCAGTIGAVGDNGNGVSGVCWDVSLLPVKFIDDYGEGYTSDAIEAIDYAVAMGAKVLNNSWGGGEYSQALKDSILAAGNAGALFIAASSNGEEGEDNNDILPHYPSSYDCWNIIAVTATDDNDNLADFAGFGIHSVDLAAPGVDILSTVPGNRYELSSGTSMATAITSGSVALVWGNDPQLTAAEIKDLILASVDNIPGLEGKIVSEGRLNLDLAMKSSAGRALRISSPNGGESYQEGYQTTIRWSAYGLDWTPGDCVALKISNDGGANWDTIPGAEALLYDEGQFEWAVAGQHDDIYMIKVEYLSDPDVEDTSDDDFIICGPVDHLDVLLDSPQYNGFRVHGICRIMARDADGFRVGTFGQYDAAGRFPVLLTSPVITPSGLSGAGNALDAQDFANGIADLTAAGMVLTVEAPPVTGELTAETADGGAIGISDSVVIEEYQDYLTELFNEDDCDLSGLSVLFVPDESNLGYSAYSKAISAFPTDPAGGTALSLSDDSSAEVKLADGAEVILYGHAYSRIFVNSNGSITFSEADPYFFGGIADHFLLQRVSAYVCDLDPDPGHVTYKQLGDRIAVTFHRVMEYWSPNANSFQVELYFDGRIRLAWLELETKSGIVGLSSGDGMPGPFYESDISAYPTLPTRTLTVHGGTGTGTYSEGDLILIEADAPAEGLVFAGWTGDTFCLANSNSAATTVTIPTQNVSVTATYIMGLRLLFPSDGGIVVENGSKVEVRWEAPGLSRKERVQVELTDGVISWIIAPKVTASKGMVRWNAGKWKSKTGQQAYTDGENYRIIVRAMGVTCEDSSDNEFAIGHVASIDIQAPAEIPESSRTELSCMLNYNYGPSRSVSGNLIKWRDDSKFAKVKKGVLETTPVIGNQTFTLTGSYGKRENYAEDSTIITILDSGF